MSPSYLAHSDPSVVRAPVGTVLVLACEWTTGNVGIGLAPGDDIGPADFVQNPGHTEGVGRLPDVFRWDDVNGFIRNVVVPLMGCVLEGCDTCANGVTFTPQAETAKGMIIRAIATWRDEIEGQR